MFALYSKAPSNPWHGRRHLMCCPEQRHRNPPIVAPKPQPLVVCRVLWQTPLLFHTSPRVVVPCVGARQLESPSRLDLCDSRTPLHQEVVFLHEGVKTRADAICMSEWGAQHNDLTGTWVPGSPGQQVKLTTVQRSSWGVLGVRLIRTSKMICPRQCPRREWSGPFPFATASRGPRLDQPMSTAAVIGRG